MKYKSFKKQEAKKQLILNCFTITFLISIVLSFGSFIISNANPY